MFPICNQSIESESVLEFESADGTPRYLFCDQKLGKFGRSRSSSHKLRRRLNNDTTQCSEVGRKIENDSNLTSNDSQSFLQDFPQISSHSNTSKEQYAGLLSSKYLSSPVYSKTSSSSSKQSRLQSVTTNASVHSITAKSNSTQRHDRKANEMKDFASFLIDNACDRFWTLEMVKRLSVAIQKFSAVHLSHFNFHDIAREINCDRIKTKHCRDKLEQQIIACWKRQRHSETFLPMTSLPSSPSQQPISSKRRSRKTTFISQSTELVDFIRRYACSANVNDHHVNRIWNKDKLLLLADAVETYPVGTPNRLALIGALVGYKPIKCQSQIYRLFHLSEDVDIRFSVGVQSAENNSGADRIEFAAVEAAGPSDGIKKTASLPQHSTELVDFIRRYACSANVNDDDRRRIWGKDKLLLLADAVETNPVGTPNRLALIAAHVGFEPSKCQSQIYRLFHLSEDADIRFSTLEVGVPGTESSSCGDRNETSEYIELSDQFAEQEETIEMAVEEAGTSDGIEMSEERQAVMSFSQHLRHIPASAMWTADMLNRMSDVVRLYPIVSRAVYDYQNMAQQVGGCSSFQCTNKISNEIVRWQHGSQQLKTSGVVGRPRKIVRAAAVDMAAEEEDGVPQADLQSTHSCEGDDAGRSSSCSSSSEFYSCSDGSGDSDIDGDSSGSDSVDGCSLNNAASATASNTTSVCSTYIAAVRSAANSLDLFRGRLVGDITEAEEDFSRKHFPISSAAAAQHHMSMDEYHSEDAMDCEEETSLPLELHSLTTELAVSTESVLSVASAIPAVSAVPTEPAVSEVSTVPMEHVISESAEEMAGAEPCSSQQQQQTATPESFEAHLLAVVERLALKPKLKKGEVWTSDMVKRMSEAKHHHNLTTDEQIAEYVGSVTANQVQRKLRGEELLWLQSLKHADSGDDDNEMEDTGGTGDAAVTTVDHDTKYPVKRDRVARISGNKIIWTDDMLARLTEANASIAFGKSERFTKIAELVGNVTGEQVRDKLNEEAAFFRYQLPAQVVKNKRHSTDSSVSSVARTSAAVVTPEQPHLRLPSYRRPSIDNHKRRNVVVSSSDDSDSSDGEEDYGADFIQYIRDLSMEPRSKQDSWTNKQLSRLADAIARYPVTATSTLGRPQLIADRVGGKTARDCQNKIGRLQQRFRLNTSRKSHKNKRQRCEVPKDSSDGEESDNTELPAPVGSLSRAEIDLIRYIREVTKAPQFYQNTWSIKQMRRLAEAFELYPAATNTTGRFQLIGQHVGLPAAVCQRKVWYLSGKLRRSWQYEHDEVMSDSDHSDDSESLLSQQTESIGSADEYLEYYTRMSFTAPTPNLQRERYRALLLLQHENVMSLE